MFIILKFVEKIKEKNLMIENNEIWRGEVNILDLIFSRNLRKSIFLN